MPDPKSAASAAPSKGALQYKVTKTDGNVRVEIVGGSLTGGVATLIPVPPAAAYFQPYPEKKRA